jgi:GR25 family glycosyltransferase involved in LPS biosynthesis
LLGPANYGVVSIALIYPLMFSGLADLGLSTAIMRYASIGDFRRAFTVLWFRVLITMAFAYKLDMMYTFVRLTKVMNLTINLTRNNFVKIFELLDTITTLYIWTSLLSILSVNSITVYELNIRDLKLYK